MARPRKATKQVPAAQQTVDALLNQTKPGRDEHKQRVLRFNNAYRVWRGQPDIKQAAGTDWRTRLYVKYGMQVVDQALVNLVQGVPAVSVKPRRPGDERPAKAMEHALGFFTDEDHLAEKEAIVAQQALIYAVSPARVRWLYDVTPSGKLISDRPTFEPWDVYNCWWDPLASDPQCAEYVVFRSYLTRDQLESYRYDADKNQGRFRNLDLLFEAGSAPPPDTRQQNQMLPLPLGVYQGKYAVDETWRATQMGWRCTITGNDKVLLYDGPSPYKTLDGPPIMVSTARPDMFRIEGISETELIDAIQQALWLVENLRHDQMKMTVLRGATVRETVPNMKALVFRPSFLWPVTDHDDVKFQEPPPLPPEAYRESDTLLSRLQYVTGITPYVSGASSSGTGVDQNTATGVSLLTQSASRLLQFKAAIIHQRTWQRMYEMWAGLTKQYITSDLMMRIAGPQDTYTWQPISAKEIRDADDDFDIRVQAGDEAANRQQERADTLALANAMAPFVQAQAINPQPILEKLGRLFGLDPNEVQKMIMPLAHPQQPPAAAPHGPNGNGGGFAMPPGVNLNQLLPGNPITPHPSGNVIQGNR